MPDSPPDVAFVSSDDSNVDSSTHVEKSELEERMWHDHPNIVDDDKHRCDLTQS